MKFSSLQPFVPSGSDFKQSKQLFIELGFQITWDAQGYTGFQKDDCRFILQDFDNRDFAENFMLSVTIEDANTFYQEVCENRLPEKFGIRIAPPVAQPYGLEVNLIDIAGVCWHFVQP